MVTTLGEIDQGRMSLCIGRQNWVGAGVRGQMNLWSQGGTTTVMSISLPFSVGIFANPS